MAIRKVEHVDLPYAGRRTSPDYSRLSALYSRGGEVLADIALRKGENAARMYGQLAGLFTNYQETGRQKKATEAATALRAVEREQDRLEREVERKEREAERKEAVRIARETQDRMAASRLVDDVAPGPVEDTPESRVMLDLANRFPETASRFRRQTTLPARPIDPTMGEMAPPTGMTVRVPTGAEARGAAQDTAAREREAQAIARAEKAAADRIADNARMTASAVEAARHNKVMENKPPSMIPVVVQTPTGPAVLDRKTLTAQPITMDGKEVGAPLSAIERMDARKFAKAAPVLDSINELSERINTLNGVIATASGVAEKAKAQVNLSDDVAEYTALVSGFTPLIARALGHVGVLTQQDVDSVKELFPKPQDSKVLRDRKIARMKTIIDQLEGIEGTGGAAAPADPLGLGLSPKPKP